VSAEEGKEKEEAPTGSKALPLIVFLDTNAVLDAISFCELGGTQKIRTRSHLVRTIALHNVRFVVSPTVRQEVLNLFRHVCYQQTAEEFLDLHFHGCKIHAMEVPLGEHNLQDLYQASTKLRGKTTAPFSPFPHTFD